MIAEEMRTTVRKQDFISQVLRPVDFSTTYKGMNRNEMREALEEDLQVLAAELIEVPGIKYVEGQVFIEFIKNTPRMKLAGEIKIEYSHQTAEAYSAVVDLMENGFMYRAARNSFIAEGTI